MGHWHQTAEGRLGDPFPVVHPGAFSGQEKGMEEPQKDPWECTASRCVAVVHS